MLNSHLERVLGKLEDLDASNLTILIQRLLRERNLLETVFNTIKEGIIVINPQGVIEYANRAACNLFAIPEKEVGVAVLWKMVPDLAKGININVTASGLVLNLMVREIEVTYPEKRFFQIYMLPLDIQNTTETRSDCVTLIFSDITEQKQRTEQALEQERFSSIFMLAAGVAHELGNPLNSMTIHLQLIQRQIESLKSSEKVIKLQNSLSICINEIQRLDGIIRNFLEAVRPVPLNFQDLDLNSLLQEVLVFQKQELEDLNIRVLYDLPPDLPIVSGDKTQLKQVFFNLIKNAMEAMDCGGNLSLSAFIDEVYLYLYFADTGVGIAHQDFPNIFEPYYTTKQSGHGLGMMIVQRIVREHQGFVGIDSQAGLGTIVTLQLPLKTPQRKLLSSSFEK
jgi:two-component system, sporulation sensor kinase E